MNIRYGSVCSGIEAASCAWEPLGWTPIFFSEIEKFPCEVLAARHPDVPNLGDMTKIDGAEWRGRIDVLVGGTPCQSFSVAGLRGGLSDARGNLTLTFVQLVRAIDPWGVVWENVPGILSDKSNAFGCFLAGLVGADAPLVCPRGSRWTDAGMVAGPERSAAWRVLDAQWFGVAQRRRRVFVVSFRAGDGANPAAVLLEFPCLRRNPAPSRETRQDVTHDIAESLAASGGGVEPMVGETIGALCARDSKTVGNQFVQEGKVVPMALFNAEGSDGATFTKSNLGKQLNNQTPVVVAHALRGEGFDASEDGTGRGIPLVTHALTNMGRHVVEDGAGRGQPVIVAPLPFDTTQVTSAGNYSAPKPGDACHPLAAAAHPPAVAFPLDMRNALRDPDKKDEMNRQGVGVGDEGDPAHTVTKAFIPAVAFTQNQAGDVLTGEVMAAMGTNQNASGRNTPKVIHPLQSLSLDGMMHLKEVHHGDAEKARPAEALRLLRESVGAEAFQEWGIGVLAAFRAKKVLQCNLHGDGLRPPPNEGDIQGNDPLPREEIGSTGEVSMLWGFSRRGYPPPGWQPSEQLAIELTAYMSLLPHEGPPCPCLLRSLWSASEGLGLLREALSEIQEMGRPAGIQAEPAHPIHQEGGLGVMVVRRLTPRLCECEILQGFSGTHTAITVNGKPAADGPRYRAIGNSFAVPVVRWIGERIQAAADGAG